MKKIKCRDCGDITWNSTERCGVCRMAFNEKVKKQKEEKNKD